ncbi:MAG: rhomboid family intramembrane serine protease [Burkholderiales bacterium]
MTPATTALIVANVLIYLLELSGSMPLIELFALWPPSTGSSVGPGFQVWQLVTYAFLHDPRSWLHIGFNMLGLYTFGRDLERLFGAVWYLKYYFASVVSAAVCHLLITGWLGAHAMPTIGASGGVYGLLLAFGYYFPKRTVILLFPPIPLPARVFVVIFAALELYLGVTGTMAGVAHFAHLGGMLGGWLMIRSRGRRRR